MTFQQYQSGGGEVKREKIAESIRVPVGASTAGVRR